MLKMVYSARRFGDGKWRIETSEMHGDVRAHGVIDEIFETELEALDRIAQFLRCQE